jgi:hypothetical protein
MRGEQSKRASRGPAVGGCSSAGRGGLHPTSFLTIRRLNLCGNTFSHRAGSSGCRAAGPSANSTSTCRSGRAIELGNRHNRSVRRLLAAAIVVVFASLNAIDGICCPDFGTHPRESASPQRRDHSGDGTCMLCLGSIVSAMVPVLAPSDLPMTRAGHPRVRSLVDAFSHPPDHPPRA